MTISLRYINVPLESFGKHKIKSIRILKEKIKITFYGGDTIYTSKEEYTNHFLYVNKEISDKEYKEIILTQEDLSLYKYAYKLVSKKMYTEFALRDKLYKKETANKNNVDKIISTLKSQGWINDKEYIDEYLKYANEKHYGKNKIIQQLLDKGIFKENIDKIIFDEGLEKKKAQYWLNRLSIKYVSKNNKNKKSSSYAFLTNQGFDIDIINEVMGEIKNNNDKEEMSLCKKDYLKIKSRLAKKYKGKELKEKIIASLLSKGYRYQEIFKVIGA